MSLVSGIFHYGLNTCWVLLVVGTIAQWTFARITILALTNIKLGTDP
jgi:hypothetical protein